MLLGAAAKKFFKSFFCQIPTAIGASKFPQDDQDLIKFCPLLIKFYYFAANTIIFIQFVFKRVE